MTDARTFNFAIVDINVATDALIFYNTYIHNNTGTRAQLNMVGSPIA